MMNFSEKGLKLKLYLEILFFPRLSDCGGRMEELKPQAPGESSRRDSFPAERFTPSPVCQIRFPSRLLPRRAASSVPVVRKADLGEALAITPETYPAQRSHEFSFQGLPCPYALPFSTYCQTNGTTVFLKKPHQVREH